MHKYLIVLLSLLLLLSFTVPVSAAAPASLAQVVTPLIDSHPGKSGAYVLEKGEEALRARAWLTDHAARSIDVQYFIWSSDNIGILASEALLRAAERGVKVRVLVDDLLIDAPPDSMLALALHPNIDIRIYNPRLNVGTSKVKKIGNVVTGLRTINQRMHDKTALFDGQAGITGGRNMADEYFDYNHSYNFRDRDMLVLGPVVADMQASFARFWESPQAVPVEKLLAKAMKQMTSERATAVYAGLHAYAAKGENFAPEVRQALEELPAKFSRLAQGIVWDEVRFLCDLPGKNSARRRFDGGGRTTAALVDELKKATRSVTIQSPYLVMPSGALEIFRDLIKRGVEVRIVTNSLASTDNLQAFSGYHKQRRAILKSGIKVFEFKPDPAIRRELIERFPKLEKTAPIFAIHAKSMVIDGTTLFVGTFNFDPRSANLNTEVGVLIRNPVLAEQVELNIIRDMAPENSWSAADNADRFAPPEKRRKLRLWKTLPLEPFL
ncbi:phospholipase D-like domain-containing protein [Pelotalea chapellei]|uniref:Phospholipase D family protein n=1 Tax=Pelotalea chapellei TaxID=44671 RepID=A0ABS5UAM6_9BACT|nr:phospholipase D family protein [Pelotalea chapellei]MBT1072739.1 phospholipase D family protein [Pelotalea chapellei]